MDIQGRGPSGRHRRSAARAMSPTGSTAIADKYFSRAIAANVTFGRGPHDDFTCDIVAPVRAGRGAQGVEPRRRRAHRVRRRGRQDREPAEPLHAAGCASARRAARPQLVENAGYTVFAAAADDEEPPPDTPAIVAETRVDIPEASVSDAVMMLDLRNTNALMFSNSGSGDFNMVYRRDDGTIGWVEPPRSDKLDPSRRLTAAAGALSRAGP